MAVHNSHTDSTDLGIRQVGETDNDSLDTQGNNFFDKVSTVYNSQLLIIWPLLHIVLLLTSRLDFPRFRSWSNLSWFGGRSIIFPRFSLSLIWGRCAISLLLNWLFCVILGDSLLVNLDHYCLGLTSWIVELDPLFQTRLMEVHFGWLFHELYFPIISLSSTGLIRTP